MNRLIDYQQDLLETLKDQQAAFHYLNAAIQDEAPRIFTLALNNVLEAQLDEEHLHTIHPIEANPTLTNVKAALNALGLHLVIQKRDQA